MTAPPIARAALTSQLVTHMVDTLAGTDVLVGRGRAPKDGGWSEGQPGKGSFVPYVTIRTGTATMPADPEPIGRSGMSWMLSYIFTYSAVMDSYVDDLADQGREAVVQFEGRPLTLRGVKWTLQQVRVPRLGATQQNESTTPAFWEVSDDVSLHLSRVRNQ